MTGGGPFGPSALAHDIAALLQAGDVVQVDDGAGVTTDVTITAVQVAEQIAPGQHVTLAAGLGAAEAGPAAARITTATDTDANMTRLFVGDASGFAAPARAGAPETVAITNGASVDPAARTLYIGRAAGEFPAAVTLQTWRGAASRGRRPDLRTGFYTGAKVELDTGSAKIERIVQSVDPAARTAAFTAGLPLGAGNFVELPADPAARRVYLRTCEIDVLVHKDGVAGKPSRA